MNNTEILLFEFDKLLLAMQKAIDILQVRYNNENIDSLPAVANQPVLANNGINKKMLDN